MNLIQFFKNLFDTLGFFVEYVVGLVKASLQGVELITDSLSFPFFISGLMPSVIASGMIAVIVASVVKFIFGRL